MGAKWRVKEVKRIKENTLDLLSGIFKRLYYVCNLEVLGQRNYAHTQEHYRERERENSSWAVQVFTGAGKQFFLQWSGTDSALPHPVFHPSPLAFLAKLLSLVSIAHLCALSDTNRPGIEAPCISSSALLTRNRTDCQEFLLQLHHLALTAAEKLQTLSEGFGPYSQAPWCQVSGDGGCPLRTDCYTLVSATPPSLEMLFKTKIIRINNTDRWRNPEGEIS